MELVGDEPVPPPPPTAVRLCPIASAAVWICSRADHHKNVLSLTYKRGDELTMSEADFTAFVLNIRTMMEWRR